MGTKTLWLMNLVVVMLLTAASASAQSTSSELAIQIRNALSTACSVVDYATTIEQQFIRLGEAVENIPSGTANKLTPDQLGRKGEDKIRDLLDTSGIPYEEQVRFSDVQSRRERRGDFFIRGDGPARVIIEVKNKKRITIHDVRQIRDYGVRWRAGDHMILAVRPGVKVSRSVGWPLFMRWRYGLITVVECVF